MMQVQRHDPQPIIAPPPALIPRLNETTIPAPAPELPAETAILIVSPDRIEGGRLLARFHDIGRLAVHVTTEEECLSRAKERAEIVIVDMAAFNAQLVREIRYVNPVASVIGVGEVKHAVRQEFSRCGVDILSPCRMSRPRIALMAQRLIARTRAFRANEKNMMA